MNRLIYFFILLFLTIDVSAQTNPIILYWLQNTTTLGSYYMNGNSTAISNNITANVQVVQYSANSVYISTKGIPSYPTGPFLDGNPSVAQSQNAIFKFPLNPQQNLGTPTATNGGNIGIFINGVALFDYRDGVSWKFSMNKLQGGPLGGMGDNVWNRDAVVAERLGFDCAKGHPAMGNYHHHQNPSAFKLDKKVISSVCSLYDADGLYSINPAIHSPLIGYAYDGFPIYGAYGYKNTNGTGGIVRIKSSYQLRSITERTHYADGTNVIDGPPVSTTYPLGYFREDYEYISHTESDFLDSHNGRFCITPEYPNGIYAYFGTVDDNWNSAYPYVVGPTFYGIKSAAKVVSVAEPTTVYTPSANTLSVNPNTLSLPSAASNYISFSISSNVNWTVSSNQTWLSLNKTSGNGNATITVIASENMSKTPRNASVKVSSPGLADQLITVTQKDTTVLLNVSLSLISLPAAFNDYVSFNVQSDAQWTASSDQPWLIVNPVQGIGNGTILLIAEENKGNAPRTAKITVECGLLAQKVVTINQSDTVIIKPSIKASPDTVYLFASNNSTGKISITSNVDWDAKVDQSWLSINSNKGSNNGEIIVQASVNNSKKVRSGKVIISSEGLPDYPITIIQKDTVLSTLTVSADTIYLPAAASNSKGFGISANTTWTVQSSDSWLTVNKNTGNGNDIIILNAEMNKESKRRNAYVTVSGKGVNDTKVFVIQADTMIISSIEEEPSDEIFATVFPNPANELLIIQAIGLVKKDIQVELYDIKGKIVSKTKVLQGSTIAFIDVQTLYSGTYFIKLNSENSIQTKKIIIQKDME
ncbi:MAG: YHYH protein [Bacteroidota bacterium]